MSSEVAELEREADNLPEGWRTVRFGDVSRSFAGGTPSRSNPAFYGPGIPWLKSGEVRAGRISAVEEEITEAGLRESSARVAKAGSPVIAMYGATAGVAGILEIDAALNQAVLAIEPVATKLDSEFCFYLLSSEAQRLLTMTQGSGQPNLSKGLINGLNVALPPLDEQRRIAEVLRSVDEAITANALALNQARLLQSCIAEDFLAKHRHDEQVMLRDVVVETGSGWSPGCDPEAARPEEWGILKTSAITWDGYDDSECKRLPDNLEAKPDLAVRAKDILITRAGQAYRTGVVAFVFATSGMRMLSDKMIRIRADEAKILPLVLCQVLKGSFVQGQLNPLKSGLTTLTNITQKMIGDVTFPLPAMADQRLFMQAVESVDEQIGYLVREADYLGGLKAALSAALLSGHVRVPA